MDREMRDNKTRFILAATVMAVLLICGTAMADAGMTTISPIHTLSQFPSHNITASFRDSDGYLWYGTDGMVCRDDGYNIMKLHIDNAGEIVAITETKDRKIWVSAAKGCYTIDNKSLTVKPFDPTRFGNSEITPVHQSRDGSIWISRKGSMSRYSADGEWEKDYPLNDRRGNPTFLSGFSEDSEGNIYITTYSRGVYKYDRDLDAFKMFAPIDKDVSLGGIVHDISGKYFWVNDHSGMIYRFDPTVARGNMFRESLPASSDKINATRRVRSFIQDSVSGNLWVITRSSLVPLRPDNEGNLIPVDDRVAKTFEEAFVTSICASDDKLWVFCYDAQSAVIHLLGSQTGKNRMEEIMTRYGDNPVILDICKDPGSGLLWMIQLRSGIILYDPVSKTFTDHDRPALAGRRLHESNRLAPSRFLNGVWVTANKSLKINGLRHNGAGEIVAADSLSLHRIIPETERITRVFEDGRNKLWIATTCGLFLYDLNTRRFVKELPGIRSAKGFARKGNTLWVTDCCALYKLTDGQPAVKTPIRGNFTALTMAPDGHLWLGSNTGRLISIDPKYGSVTDYTEHLSRKGNEINQIYIDKFSHTWIVTDRCVTQFNPRNKTFRNYDAGTEGNLKAYMSAGNYITPDDEIAVGGMGGLAFFTPSNCLDVDIEEQYTHISDVKVNGVSILGNGGGAYPYGKLELEPDDANIEFFFSTLDQTNASDERFAYRIEGVDKDWNYTDVGDNRAFYNSLPDGEWTLEVKACDENNYWSRTSTTLEINKPPRFYLSWYAILLYIIAGVALLSFILKKYLKHVNDKNEEMWTDSTELVKMRKFLTSQVSLPEEEFRELDKVLLDKATKVVEKNISIPDFGVADLADGVNMSKSSLARKLKAITGKTPLDFIRNIKMQYARKLLESQNHTVAEVAEMLGFEDRRYFTTTFKKEVGITPSGYLKGERPEGESQRNAPRAGAADEPRGQDSQENAGDTNDKI